MVGGRLYMSGEGARFRRAASVPVVDLSPPVDTAVLHQARVISSHAVQDADAMRAASKKHDMNFLNDISNKMAAATQPRHFYKESTPVYIGSRPPVNNSSASDYRRRSLYAAPQGTDYEVSSYLAGGPQAYGSTSRGVSVPPVRGPSVPRWHAPSPSRSVRGSSASRGLGYSREKLAPYEDVVVGVAHTSLYGDIVIGIPYHKRHMFEMDGSDLEKSSYKVTRPSNGARHSIASNYNIGTMVTPPSSRRASIAAPSTRTALYNDVDEYLSTTPRHRSSIGYKVEYPTGRPPLAPGRASSVQRQDYGTPEYSGYSSYRPRASSMAPVYSSYSAPSASYSSSSAPSASYSNGGSSLPPFSASSMPPKAPRTYSRPPVSEARRKVRDLLCRTKNDPNYFEGF